MGVDWKSLMSAASTDTQHRSGIVLQPPAVVLSPSATIVRNSSKCQSFFTTAPSLEKANPPDVAPTLAAIPALTNPLRLKVFVLITSALLSQDKSRPNRRFTRQCLVCRERIPVVRTPRIFCFIWSTAPSANGIHDTTHQRCDCTYLLSINSKASLRRRRINCGYCSGPSGSNNSSLSARAFRTGLLESSASFSR